MSIVNELFKNIVDQVRGTHHWRLPDDQLRLRVVGLRRSGLQHCRALDGRQSDARLRKIFFSVS